MVTGLWDSFADNPFVRDVSSGLFFDPARMHVLDHHGPHFNVRGPLTIARPVQGWPVIVQAGSSEAGRQLAAGTAELVFAAGPDLAAGQRFCADVKTRMQRLGRDPDHMKILPAAFVVVGDSIAEAEDRRAQLEAEDRRAQLDALVPELQRRGLFRREYEATTLRQNLGLPRPGNRFFERPAQRA